MKNLYLFSGLGADKRIFQRLDLSGFSVHYVEWPKPARQDDIHAYAQRLSQSIAAVNPTFIGLSFGGMMAIEVSKYLPIEQLILISSAKHFREIPFYFRWMGKTRLHRTLPTNVLKGHNFLKDWVMGAQHEADRRLLAQILQDTEPAFFRWAIDQVLSWQNTYCPPNCTHIHGTADLLLPIRFVNPDIAIPGGDHLMTLNKADIISEKIRGLLSDS